MNQERDNTTSDSMPYNNDYYPVHLLPSSSTGRWRTARDVPSRRKIMEEM